MFDFEVHLRNLREVLLKLGDIDLINNVDLEIQKASLNDLQVLVLGFIDKKNISKLNENFPNIKFIYDKEGLGIFNNNDELNSPIHLVIQLLSATQPVSKTDKHIYLKMSKYFPAEHHLLIVNHLEDIEDIHERLEVKEYIENKIKEFAVQSKKVLYLPSNYNELVKYVTNKGDIIKQSLAFNIERLYGKTVNHIKEEINRLENYNEYKEARIVELRRRLFLINNSGSKILHYLKVSLESSDALIDRIVSFAEANNLKINFDISKEKNLLLQEFIQSIEDNCKDIRNEVISLYQNKCDQNRLLTLEEQLYILESKGVINGE